MPYAKLYAQIQSDESGDPAAAAWIALLGGGGAGGIIPYANTMVIEAPLDGDEFTILRFTGTSATITNIRINAVGGGSVTGSIVQDTTDIVASASFTGEGDATLASTAVPVNKKLVWVCTDVTGTVTRLEIFVNYTRVA